MIDQSAASKKSATESKLCVLYLALKKTSCTYRYRGGAFGN
jgi:hypothetical protein